MELALLMPVPNEGVPGQLSSSYVICGYAVGVECSRGRSMATIRVLQVWRWWARALGVKSSSRTALTTRFVNSGLTNADPLITYGTVSVDTPARFATS
ncbi:MAG TPA: hypothetical protein VES20_12280 [Bryobacteraceae bacterium]|nr:hypothetical protein [Bryobacteraceae bacterium]